MAEMSWLADLAIKVRNRLCRKHLIDLIHREPASQMPTKEGEALSPAELQLKRLDSICAIFAVVRS